MRGATDTAGARGDRMRRLLSAAVLAWGLLLAIWLARVYFVHPPDRVHATHENISYAVRLLEFRDLLGAGHASPQWATHFRGGLGSPYFAYYQPGFFYAASAVPWSVPIPRALGMAVVGFAWLGFASVFWLVRRGFGVLSGALAGSMLLLAVYPATDVYVRGDLSELGAMMLFAAALCALALWLADGRARHAVLLACAGGATIATHPAVALVGYGALALLIAGAAVATRSWRRAAGAAAALAGGVGLASFYWFPVFFEWNLVDPEAAFSGGYHHSLHFVEPSALVGAYARNYSGRPLVPLTLGPLLPSLLLLNAAAAWLRRRDLSREQWTAMGLGLLALAACVFLMTPASAFVWDRVELLRRVQFPWRLHALVAVLAAALCGAALPWKRELARVALVAGVVLAAFFASRTYTATLALEPGPVPSDVAALERLDFAPDAADEWMPRGARKLPPARLATLPQVGPGARVTEFAREQGLLRARVRARRASYVVLPHYTFPVGWHATVDGEPVALSADGAGLMRVSLPAGVEGELRVRFSATPARVHGWWASLATCAAGAAALLVARRLGRRRGAT